MANLKQLKRSEQLEMGKPASPWSAIFWLTLTSVIFIGLAARAASQRPFPPVVRAAALPTKQANDYIIPPAALYIPPQPSQVPTQTTLPTYTPASTQTPYPTLTAVSTPLPVMVFADTQTPAPTQTTQATYTPYPLVAPIATIDIGPLKRQITSLDNDLQTAGYGMILLSAIGALMLATIIYQATHPSVVTVEKIVEVPLQYETPPTPTSHTVDIRVLPPPTETPQRERVAPKQAIVPSVAPVTPVLSPGRPGVAPPERVTVEVKPINDIDEDLAMKIIQTYNRLWLQLGRPPSQNAVIKAMWGSKNSVRMAVVRRAIEWGGGDMLLSGLVDEEEE